jgi:hypothetical protein
MIALQCFGSDGRLASLKNTEVLEQWNHGLGFKPFRIRETLTAFTFARPDNAGRKVVSSNIASVWTPHHSEVLIGGTRQGFKQFSDRGRSLLCRRSLWHACLTLARSIEDQALVDVLTCASYDTVKCSPRLACRRVTKQDVKDRTLANWTSNRGDENFSLD